MNVKKYKVKIIKPPRTKLTSIRLKIRIYEILQDIMKEKELNCTEAIEYCIQVYDEFLQDKIRYTKKVVEEYKKDKNEIVIEE